MPFNSHVIPTANRRYAVNGLSQVIIVQARRASSRLPDKVLLELCGKPMLIRQIERIARAKVGARIVVATSTHSGDDKIANLCADFGIDVFRGHPTDLLDRHFQAAKAYKADVIAKIPSDCPLIDPSIIESVFARYHASRCDYASNLHPPSFPDGNDVEVMNWAALATAWEGATLPFEREHTTPYIWERPEVFKIANVSCTGHGSDGNFAMTHRWTVDYPEDFELVEKVFSTLYLDKPDFTMADILALLEKQPELMQINAKYLGVNWYRHHLNELRTIDSWQTRRLDTM